MGIGRITALILACLPQVAQADTLLCLGKRPSFLITMTEATATFDYLGDGVFRLDPPLSRATATEPRALFSSRTEFPMFVDRRACEVRQLDMPITIRLIVPTSSGPRLFAGCCIWKSQ